MVDDMGEGVGGRGLGGGRDVRSGCGWFIRNLGVLSSRASEVSSVCARVPADCCWGTVVSSSSSSEGKKSESWFLGVLGRDSGWEGSCQLRLFEVEMVTVRESTMPDGKLDLLLCLVLGKGASIASGSRGRDMRRVYTS